MVERCWSQTRQRRVPGKYGFVMNEVTTAAEKFYIADEEGIYNVTTLWKWKMCC